ncbi:hypothetical protein PWT90_08276 [Aphanocladium album]|nr:hypothetical protein PWT90_08276 [Aphanocladium album]
MAGKCLILSLMAAVVLADGPTPAYKTDPNTTKYCSFWLDNDGSTSCKSAVDDYVVGDFADFLRWTAQSYCIEALNEPRPTTTKPPTSSQSPTTTTKPNNGITTPTPTQPGMVDNCNKFHYISTGNTCDQITSYNHISQEDFAAWNPNVGKQCSGMWANAYACVGVIGGTATTTSSTPTQPTGNGVSTPTPTQPGMVTNCNKFHYIWSGNTCDQITSYNQISQHDFATWNTNIGEQCTGMWAEAYACVGVIGGSTPTQPGNGIETPQPTQPHMVKNCNKFHYIYKDNTCGQITSFNHISQDDFATWNPDIGEQCTGIWADAYACVGVTS